MGSLVQQNNQPGEPFAIAKICADAPSVAAGRNEFVVIASCAPAPNPWGWGGPGGFAAARVNFDGSVPDANVDYGYYKKDLAARTKSNILDSSQWKHKPDLWPAGVKGGFAGTHNDRWPHIFSSVAACGDSFVSVWLNRKVRNRWELTDGDLIGCSLSASPWKVDPVGGIVIAGTEDHESAPALASDGKTVVLVYEHMKQSGGLQVEYRVLSIR
jgi:hypothetical protein